MRWQDSPRGDVEDDARRRTLPRQFGRSGGSTEAVGGGLRHRETLPRAGVRPALRRELALDMLDADWPGSHELDDDLRQVHVPAARPSSRRRSYYRGDGRVKVIITILKSKVLR